LLSSVPMFGVPGDHEMAIGIEQAEGGRCATDRHTSSPVPTIRSGRVTVQGLFT
jgi:hypothetical protein